MTSQRCLLADEKVALLGITQSCFESAMFIFVFEWTPALESSASTMHLPHGLIFAVFMVCIMIGSNLFKTFLGWQPVEHFSRGVFVVSSVALAVPVFFTVRGGLLLQYEAREFTLCMQLQNHTLILLAFCVFELCCGVYFPSMGVQRGKYIPEEVRATMMNIFRVGLNLVVVLVLANVRATPPMLRRVFSLASVCERRLTACSNLRCSCCALWCWLLRRWRSIGCLCW